MKKWIVILLLPFLLGCGKKEIKDHKADFETLMGSQFPAWKHVQTREDFENLKFYKEIYEKNIPLLQAKSSMSRVPKVIHFIWIGPKPFPRESIENIRSWIAHNPDWTVKFWTDRDRPLPHKQMQLARVQDLQFLHLFDCYKKSENYAEKSDLLRYEILYQEGGIYVDHDVKCFGPFDSLSKTYDFFCGMEMPAPSALSTTVHPTNNLIGARPGHPIFKRSMEWLDHEWDRIEKDYPGKDRDSLISRVSHRTFCVLGDSFKLLANRDGNLDIALPTFYFNAPDEKHAILARHLYKGTWFENETEFERIVRERLVRISKKTNKILLVFGVFSLINTVGFVLLYLKYRKKTMTTT